LINGYHFEIKLKFQTRHIRININDLQNQPHMADKLVLHHRIIYVLNINLKAGGKVMKTDKRPLIMGVTVMLLLLVVIVGGILLFNKGSQIELLNQQNSTLNTTLEDRDSLVNEMVSTFDEIEQNLTFIRNKRDQMISVPLEGGKSQKEILVADIKLMNEMLEESSKKIEELDKKLTASGIEIKSFKNKIAQLNKSIAEQDNNIQQLRAELEQRDSKIADMDTQIVQLKSDIASKADSIETKSQIIAEKSQTIEEKENEMNEVYFVAGTYDQLAKMGVLTKEGGFLGIAKNKTIRDDVSENNFEKLDMRNTIHFPLNTKKAKLISQHPDNSYHLVEQNDNIAFLEIEDPDEFWKLTKYVIVETK
jgi:predicted  nucleic acid-binding Zn-ribbon protein